MEKFATKNGVSFRAYKGDAMTLLAFDVSKELKENLAGFTIFYRFKLDGKEDKRYVFNRLTLPPEFLKKNPQIPKIDLNSTLYSPIQKFNWVHVPNTNINTENPVFGAYTYEITPRYIKNGKLLDLDKNLTVKLSIAVSPFNMKKTKVGFTRGFVSSTAYAKRFNVNNNKVRPKNNELLFDIKQVADKARRWNDDTRKYEEVTYTFEEQHQWLGWQARQRILGFLDEAIADSSVSVKAFIYDLDEPEVCKRLLLLAKENRLSILLDNAGKHGNDNSFESGFATMFKETAAGENSIHRGCFLGLAHSKVFVQLKGGKAIRVLTGSTNFSTNGLYVNSNHVLIFDSKKIAQLYTDAFDAAFNDIDKFKGSDYSIKEFEFTETGLPALCITFAPHTKQAAQKIFDRISTRIAKTDNTDVLFAIMKDTSKSGILDAVKKQVESNKVFTYGITDTIGDAADYSVFLYKPNSKKGIRVAAKGIANLLPKPFGRVAKIDGYAIHHKFVVVNFKGADPVVYCGSSNLAFDPEQKNGDNLLEVRDKDVVTAFAIEALRLVDHFHWRNYEIKEDEVFLDDLRLQSKWYAAWFKTGDLRCRQRELYIKA